MCTFCIIPYRRGRQVSRSIAEIALEVETLVSKGVKEVTLLGQTVDAYGYDLPDKPNLADLFARLDQIDGIERIRFLTSHPKFMTQEIIQAVADVPKVCEHINLPVQAGDDEILDEMRRQYSRQDYIDLVGRIREAMPEVALNTDIIVGFPGETEEQFQQTLDLLAVLKLDKVHCAAYSTRPGTIASRTMSDTVPEAEKTKRRQRVDLQQEQIQTEINAKLVGQYVEILVEGRQRGKWQGRTRSHKLVFFEDEAYHLGNLVQVKIDRSSPWSLQGTLAVRAKLLNPISYGTNRGED
jgi:tRNA-2-methylthio-N6-dimethylallyladenosine synthase